MRIITNIFRGIILGGIIQVAYRSWGLIAEEDIVLAIMVCLLSASFCYRCINDWWGNDRI